MAIQINYLQSELIKNLFYSIVAMENIICINIIVSEKMSDVFKVNMIMLRTTPPLTE